MERPRREVVAPDDHDRPDYAPPPSSGANQRPTSTPAVQEGGRRAGGPTRSRGRGIQPGPSCSEVRRGVTEMLKELGSLMSLMNNRSKLQEEAAKLQQF